MNERGQMPIGKIFLLMAIAIIFVIITAIIMFFVHTLSSSLLPVAQQTLINGSNATAMGLYNGTVGELNGGYAPMQWAVIAIIVTLCISFLLSCFIARNHPVVIIPYSLIVIVAVIFSVLISNEYGVISSDPVLGTELAGFMGVSWFFLNLPIIIAVLGLVGGFLIVQNFNKGAQDYYG